MNDDLSPTLLSAVPEIEDPACEANPDLFFPNSEQVDAYEAAISLCQACKGKTKCLEFATENKIRYGAWGGTSPVDRGYWNYGAPRNDEDFGRYINTAKYYTGKQLAEILGRSYSSIAKFVRRGVLPQPDRVINHRGFWKRDTLDIEAVKKRMP